MIARLLIPSLLAMLLAPALVIAQEPYGTYSYVKGQRGDQPVPEENLKDSTIKIEEGKLSLIGPDGEVQFEITYIVDEEPEEGLVKASMEIVKSSIMPESVGSKAKVLAKHNGSEITIIYDYASQDYPEGFEPKGPTQHLFVIKRKLATSN